MKIDNTNRRAFIAFCMDAMMGALTDQDVLQKWREDGIPEGPYDDVPIDVFTTAGENYRDTVEGMSESEWEELCTKWLFAMMRGCIAGEIDYENTVFVEGSVA